MASPGKSQRSPAQSQNTGAHGFTPASKPIPQNILSEQQHKDSVNASSDAQLRDASKSGGGGSFVLGGMASNTAVDNDSGPKGRNAKDLDVPPIEQEVVDLEQSSPPPRTSLKRKRGAGKETQASQQPSLAALATRPLKYSFRKRQDFDDHLAAAYRANVQALPSRVFDPTIPQTDMEKQQCVSDLFRAFINTDGVIDKPTLAGKAQAVQKIEDRTTNGYDAEFMELESWRCLWDAIDIQNKKEILRKHDQLATKKYDSFEARWTAIKKAARESKALVKQVFEHSNRHRLVCAPEGFLKSKVLNHTINGKRDAESFLGRKQMKAQGLTSDAVTDQMSAEPRVPYARRNLPGAASSKEALENPSQDEEKSQRPNEFPGDMHDGGMPGKRLRRGRAPRSMNVHSSTMVGPVSFAPDQAPQDNEGLHRSAVQDLVGAPSGHVAFEDDNEHLHDMTAPGPSLSLHGPSDGGELYFGDGPPQSYSFNPMAGLPGHIEKPLGMDDDLRYRRIICIDLLDVSPDFIRHFSLQQLRQYARAYHGEYLTNGWKPFTGPEDLLECYGCEAYFADLRHAHFTVMMPELGPLAAARGDINVNGASNRDHNRFVRPVSDDHRRALGEIDNSQGVWFQYPNRLG